MNTYVFLKPTCINVDFCNALESELPEELTKFSAPLEKAFEEIKNWTQNVAQGKVLSSFGNQVAIEIPMDKITDLSDFIKKFEYTMKACLAIGVGLTTREAYEAMCESEACGGEKVVLYSADVERDNEQAELVKDEGQYGFSLPGLELDEQDMAQDPQQQQEQMQPQEPKESPSVKQKIMEALMMVKQHSGDIAKLKEINPQAYEAIKKVIDGMIGMASGKVNKSEVAQVEEEMSEAPEGTEDLEKVNEGEPVGWVKNHRVKVESRDEITRRKDGEHTHRVSAGMAMGATGHPVSPLFPDKK